MKKLSNRAWMASILSLALLIGTVTIIFRYIKYSEDWYSYRDKGQVYSGSKFVSGQIYDRTDTLLLDGREDREYPEDETLRRAMVHILGDIQGNIPDYLLSYYRDEMNSFNLFDGGQSPDDAVLRLTVSAEVQKVALEALGQQKGTVGVYNYRTGEILCMVSTPCFDPLNPSEVDDSEMYEGAYINRFVHASYTPGSTFKLVTAAAAISELKNLDELVFVCKGYGKVDGSTLVCNGVHGEINFDQALTQSCNVAFAEIAQTLGKECLEKYARIIGINNSLEFDGLKTQTGNFDLSDAGLYQTAWAGVGQYTNSINPCQFMTFMGAIANGGISAQPYLVKSTYSRGIETYRASLRYGNRILSAEVAERLALSMHEAVVNGYGEWRFPQVYIGAKTGTAERDGGKTANGLFAGFVQEEKYPLAFVVVVEEGGSGSGAAIPIINRVLNACIAVLDAAEKEN